MKDDCNWKGTYVNWIKFNHLKEERWEQSNSGLTHCKVHNTYFVPDGSGNPYDYEPCWQCYNECEVRIV